MECLCSLEKIDHKNFDVYVLDNGSQNNEGEKLERQFKDIFVIKEKVNLGFVLGNNKAIEFAKTKKDYDYYLLLNNDTKVKPDFLKLLVDKMEQNSQIGILGPRIILYYEEDYIQNQGMLVNMYTGNVKQIDNYKKIESVLEDTRNVDAVTGCSFLIRAEVIENIGLLDKDYFAYYEEVDYCLRAKKAGYKIVCLSKAVIWHKHQRSFGQVEVRPFQLYLFTRNRILFIKKQADLLQKTAFVFYMIFYYIPKKTVSYIIYKRSFVSFKNFYKGLWHGLIGRGGYQ